MAIVEATVGRYSRPAHMVHEFIVLTDVVVDGEPFRDHVWLKATKRLQGLSRGDRIRFTAKQIKYLDSSLNEKIGFKSVRNVTKI